MFHEFILSISGDQEFLQTLQQIKEGVLLYEGIRYSGDLNGKGAWKKDLVLILDTEILFAAGGYNSKMYQEQYEDLRKYVNEINRGCPPGHKRIRMVYFAESKREIDNYFESAVRIIRHLDILDPTKDAMNQIVNSCETPSDVKEKRAFFLQKLKKEEISGIEKNFYDLETGEEQYNLESAELLEKYSKEFKEDKEIIHQSAVCLSHVNVLRKGISDQGFENCGHILVTATGRTLKLARKKEFLKNGDVPLATSLDFLINRFWFKLNKGFGMNQTPRTLDMVVRSRYILASIINSKASEKYDEMKEKYENKEISKEDFCTLNESLKSQLKQPEEIDETTIGEEIDDIDRWNMQYVLEEQRRREIELRNIREENSSLKAEIAATLESHNRMQSEYKRDRAQDADEIKNLQRKNQEINEKWKDERKKRHHLEEDVEMIKAELYEEKKRRLQEQEKKEKRKRIILRMIVIILLIIGITIYYIGSIKDTAWARGIGALLSVGDVVAFVFHLLNAKNGKRLKAEKQTASKPDE